MMEPTMSEVILLLKIDELSFSDGTFPDSFLAIKESRDARHMVDLGLLEKVHTSLGISFSLTDRGKDLISSFSMVNNIGG